MKKVIVSLVALMLLAGVVSAQQGPMGKGDCDFQHRGMGQRHGGHGDFGEGFHGFGPMMAMADKLDLTDAQKDKLEKMRTAFQKERIDKKAEIDKAKIDLRVLRRDDNANENEVMSAIDKVSYLRAELQKMAYRHRKEVQGVLTEEQIDKLKELRKEKFENRQNKGFGMKRFQGNQKNPEAGQGQGW